MTHSPIPAGLSSKLRQDFLKDREKITRMNAVTKNGIDASGLSYKAAINTPNVFSNEVKTGEITAQNKSGRCWLFASLNTMRLEVMKKCGLETFELSQAYLFFWDKFEKANFFLESIIKTLDEPLDGRLIAHLLSAPFNDGGQWDMAAALIEKYGVVPKYIMPDTHSAEDSARMNKYLTLKARECAKILRDKHNGGSDDACLRFIKEEMLADFYNILCICLGVPPDSFDFEVRGKEDNFTRAQNITPNDFYNKYIGLDLNDYISLINAPTDDKPYNHTFTVDYLGNVSGGKPVLYLNLPIKRLKQAALAQLLDGKAVWFGCDVGQMLDRDHGLMAMDTYGMNDLFQTTFNLDKAGRLNYSESLMTHAMVFTGANVVNGGVTRWKVENSWGDKSGEKGWYRMSDKWFNEYVYQVVVQKKYLNAEELKALELEPIHLKPWDPMGSLA